MKENIEAIVDALPEHGRKAGDVKTHRPRMRRTRLLAKGSPLLTILLVIGITSAVLGGMYWSFLQVEISGTTTLHGKTVTSVFEWDGQHILGTLEIPVDVTDLYPGDSIEVTHTIKNCDMGTWLISFNDSSLQSIYNNPEDPYYGFNLSMSPDDFTLEPFEEQVVTLTYYMHYEMMSPALYNASEDFNYSVTVDIKAVTAPLANPDESGYHLFNTHYKDVYVLANDIDYSGGGLTITSCTWDSGNPGTIQIFSDYVCITCSTVGLYTLTYTIEDGNGMTDSSTITLNVMA